MRFFNLSCAVGDEAAAVQEIESYMKGSTRCSVIQLHHNHSSTTRIKGYVICKFVKNLVPVDCTEYSTVLQLILSDVNVEQSEVSYFRTKFYNNMALDMNDAIENLKINDSDMIVLQRPVVSFNTDGKFVIGESGICEAVTVEVGLRDGQVIDVWHQQQVSDTINKALALKSVSRCIDQLNIKSIAYLKKNTNDDASDEAILSYFVKPIQVWKKQGQVVKAICLFREIQLNGKVGCFFNTAFHRNFANQFFQAVEDKSVIYGDIVAFINPEVFANPGHKSGIISSGEPYFLDIGCGKEENVIFCKIEKSLQSLTKDSQSENLPTCSAQASQDGQQVNEISSSSLLSTPPEKCCDYSYLIPISLAKPSEENLRFQNLSLVSGYCNHFCQKMLMYSEILWNAEKEPFCPKCHAILQLSLCLELHALSVYSGEVVKIVLVGNKAEKFLQVSCKDFLDNNERRKLAVEVLERSYAMDDEYKACKLQFSDVSACYKLAY